MADKVTLKDSTTGNIIYPQTLVDQVQNAAGTLLSNLVLMKDNTTAFMPTADYHPATKKYVDEHAGNGGGIYQVFHVGTTAPDNTNLLWIDTANGLKYYNGSAWVTVPVAYK